MNTEKFQVDSCLVYYDILQNQPLLIGMWYRTAAGIYVYDSFRRVPKIAKSAS
jgi:hypothetical protein